MIFVTRRERFSSAHRLFREDWTDQKNFDTFGKCSNSQWHGHNYILYVTVKGNINPETGFVVNLKDLSRLMKEKVINKLDHHNINTEVDFMEGQIVSTENIVVSIWNELYTPIKLVGACLHKIKLIETENNYVEYYGT